ncbi:hypothetical protein [Chitinimonas lacunae]|uniref:DUF4178 domain-containing protein n=1 Tax=Chitinimonas lacunae TaxID=1963018 RepID=A0ABV8MQ75_9NEIS
MLENMKFLNGRVVEGIFLRIFPPYGEGDFSSADISVGLRLLGEKEMLLIFVSSEDNWAIKAAFVCVPKFKAWLEFERDLPAILNGEKEVEYAYVFYDVSGQEVFSEIVGKKIVSVEALTIDEDWEPFGLKLNFERDYILVYPNTDGSAFETKLYKHGRGLGEFEVMGGIQYKKL